MQTNEFGQSVGDPLPGWQPRRRPERISLDGVSCRLEPLTPEHAPPLYEAVCASGDDRQWTYLPAGPFDGLDGFAAYVEQRAANPAEVTYAILPKDGDWADIPTGFCSLMRIDEQIGTIEVGGILFTHPLSGSRAATDSMFLLADYVFSELGYRRYEWKCDAFNVPSRRAAVRLGFNFEGVWRNATMYKGRSRDTAWFAMTDSDWLLLRPAYLRWLADDNFAGGRQRSSLSELTAQILLHAT